MPICMRKQLLTEGGVQMIGFGIDQLVCKSPAFIRTGIRNINDDIAVVSFKFIQDRFKGMARTLTAQRHIIRAIGAEQQEAAVF